MARAKRPKLERDVFINCPFDGQYAPLFHALVFTVAACGCHNGRGTASNRRRV